MIDDLNTVNLPVLVKAAAAVRDGFEYNPGHSDLDNEQPIVIHTTLGAWRDLNYAISLMRRTSDGNVLQCSGAGSRTRSRALGSGPHRAAVFRARLCCAPLVTRRTWHTT